MTPELKLEFRDHKIKVTIKQHLALFLINGLLSLKSSQPVPGGILLRITKSFDGGGDPKECGKNEKTTMI